MLLLSPDPKRILQGYLVLFLFVLSLGIGTNLSGYTFWLTQTNNTMVWEWGFILLYLLLLRHRPLFLRVWRDHKTIAYILFLWGVSVMASYMSAGYSLHNSLASIRLAETYTHLLFFLFLWSYLEESDLDVRPLYLAILFATIIVMAYMIYVHFAFPALKATGGVFTLPSDELILNTHLHRIGYMVEAALGFSVAFILSGRYRPLFSLLFAILFLFLLWLGGRAALLGGGLIVVFLFHRLRSFTPPRVLVTVILIIAILATVAVALHLVDLSYIANAFKKTFEAESPEQLMSGRLYVWSLVFQNLKGHWLLGNGPQSYFFYFDRPSEVIHAHNFILQFLGEWGIIGTGLFIALLSKAFLYGCRIHSFLHPPIRKKIHLAAGLVIIALTVTGLFGGIYFFPQSCVYLILAFAVWIAAPKNNREESSKSQ